MLDTERVDALRDQGLSLRDIAAAMGTNLAAVQRALARRPSPEPEPDDDADPWDSDDTRAMLAMLDAEDVNEDELQGPFRYVGTDDSGDRFVDANGKSCNPLHIYRVAHHRGEGYEDDDGNPVYAQVTDEMMRQAKAGTLRIFCGLDYQGWFADAMRQAEAGRGDPGWDLRG